MTRIVRGILLLISVGQLLMALAFCFQLPLATALWPFPGTTPLTYIFVASIIAAAGAATLWAAWTEQNGAFAGIGLDYLMITIPLGILAMQLFATTGSMGMLLFAALCALCALVGGALLLWSRRMPLDRGLRARKCFTAIDNLPSKVSKLYRTVSWLSR